MTLKMSLTNQQHNQIYHALSTNILTYQKLELQGIEPRTSHMLSERSTI